MTQVMFDDLVASVVENDPQAVNDITQAWKQASLGIITHQRAARLADNAKGHAIQRWLEQRRQRGLPPPSWFSQWRASRRPQRTRFTHAS